MQDGHCPPVLVEEAWAAWGSRWVGCPPAGGRRKLLEVRPEWPRGKAGPGRAQMVPVEEAVGTAASSAPSRAITVTQLAAPPGLRGDLPHRRLPGPPCIT